MTETAIIPLVIGKPLRCRGGHVLGLVDRGPGKVSRLHVLRMSEAEYEQPEDSNVGMLPTSWFNATITEGVVRCSICGRERRFVNHD